MWMFNVGNPGRGSVLAQEKDSIPVMSFLSPQVSIPAYYSLFIPMDGKFATHYPEAVGHHLLYRKKPNGYSTNTQNEYHPAYLYEQSRSDLYSDTATYELVTGPAHAWTEQPVRRGGYSGPVNAYGEEDLRSYAGQKGKLRYELKLMFLNSSMTQEYVYKKFVYSEFTLDTLTQALDEFDCGSPVNIRHAKRPSRTKPSVELDVLRFNLTSQPHRNGAVVLGSSLFVEWESMPDTKLMEFVNMPDKDTRWSLRWGNPPFVDTYGSPLTENIGFPYVQIANYMTFNIAGHDHTADAMRSFECFGYDTSARWFDRHGNIVDYDPNSIKPGVYDPIGNFVVRPLWL